MCGGANDWLAVGVLPSVDVFAEREVNPDRVIIGWGATDVSATISESCASMFDGSVKCWGGNVNGQGGGPNHLDGIEYWLDELTIFLPHGVSGISGAVAVALNEDGGYSCAVTRLGLVRCWGATDGSRRFISNGFAPITTSVDRIPVGAKAINSDGTCAITWTDQTVCWANPLAGVS
jgi:hypothetical protein